MKTILWATLTANGNYAQSSAEHPPKPEALNDFAAQARAAGNMIVGRRTFEGMQDSSRIAEAEMTEGNPFADLDIVLLSRSVSGIPGVTSVTTPQEALAYLAGRGHQNALLAGGETLHNAFLANNLVDEVVFNIAPAMESKGYNLVIGDGQYKDLQLIDCKDLGSGIIQLHYTVNK